MKHFTRQQWKAFAAGQVKAPQSAEMEKHLLVCDRCVDLYLSLLSPADEFHARTIISPRFTANVMQKVSLFESKRNESARQKRNFFYYVAVACLTLLFTSAGVFQSLTQDLPKLARAELNTVSIFAKEEEQKIQFGWSEILLKNAGSVLDTIKPEEDRGY
ncbi:MAG: hypothetical protein GX357_04940 [Firmicutes bacterium]|nr:hypothetical protein [Bacillota bacterium]